MRINHNISALNTFNKLSSNTASTQGALEKLSSGLQINKAADDAAGLAISERMKAQVTGLDTASDNVQKGISMVQTAEGALGNIQTQLQTMIKLANEANNSGINSTTDAARLQEEADQLAQNITQIANNTNFNGKHIVASSGNTAYEVTQGTGASAKKIDSSLFGKSGLTIQAGANAGETIVISLKSNKAGLTGVTATNLGISSGTTVGGADTVTASSGKAIDISKSSSITKIQSAINNISAIRSLLGAYQNRLSYAATNLDNESENLQSAESNITDVDMSKEMTEFTKNNILVQSATSMLAQANQLPQNVLSLLRG